MVLFQILKEIKEQGVSILYISHRMEEIFEMCDSITVIRDGCFVDSVEVKDVTPDQVVRMMVGRNIENLYPEKAAQTGEVVLEVNGLTSRGVFEDVSFALKKGEVLGFYGLVGAGRTEVMRAMCGIDQKDDGEIIFKGQAVKNQNYKEAISHGFAYLTEDRKSQGLFLDMTIEENIAAAKVDNIRSGLTIDKAKQGKLCDRYVGDLEIKIASNQQKVKSLSGGNQQKVMIGKWLATNPQLLIMDEPTRGIDVGAKSEIQKMLRKLANEGIGVIIISSELPEIIGVADRVVVMHEGKISGELSGSDLSEENIIVYASGAQQKTAAS